MSKNTSVKLSPTSQVNPILLKALGSLDLELEAELLRYRRLRFKKGALTRVDLTVEIKPDLSITDTHPTAPSRGEESNFDNFFAINPVNASLVYQPSDLVEAAESQVPQPDDYLESSARLLESLAQEETFIAGDEKLLEGVLTPLSITSMLMFLVAGALVGSVFLGFRKQQQLAFNPNNSPREENLIATTPEEGEQLSLPTLIDPPNFAAVPRTSPQEDEFIDLDLASLTTVEPSPRSYGKIDKLPVASSQTNPIANSTVSTSKPKLTVGTGNLTDALLRGDLTQEPLQSYFSLDFYYVLIPYTGDRSLELAQTIVKDAYIRQLSQGKWIQMGAFKTRVDADIFVEQLKDKSIFASVYP